MDILFGKIRPYLHKVSVSFVDGITSTDTIILRANKPEYQGLALQIVFTKQFIDVATKSSTGTKMPRANWQTLRDYNIPVPSNKLLLSYQNKLDGFLEKMEIAVQENRKLCELRDWLLPMLMNGQVTVKNTKEK
jgi:type I restriction enzyme S subunit